MDITSEAHFAAEPSAVYTMLTSKEYLERVCEATRATDYQVRVAGATTVVTRSLPAPEMAARFTGPTLTVVEETTWQEPGGDGSRVGVLKLTVTGQPVTMNGTTSISANGTGTVLALHAQLKVAIPLLGKKMEQAAAPAITSGFRTHQSVGSTWLTGQA
jgi:hypothetical protein